MNTELSLELYCGLYQVRCAEQGIVRHYAENDMKTPMHMTMGQEVPPVAVCRALADLGGGADVYATYRSHGTFLAQTNDIERFFAEMYGKATGTAYGKAGSMHLAAPETGLIMSSAIVASTLPVAVGTAFANRQLTTGRMTAVFFGDGAIDEGVFWESVNAACVMRIPLLFVCEDNGLAVHTGQTPRHGYLQITEVIERFACDVYRDDSNDVEAVYAMAKNAAAQAKNTGRPAFLQIKCPRYLEHVGIAEDWDAGYRDRADYEGWFSRDCVAVQRRRLLDNGVAETTLTARERAIATRVDAAILAAKAAPEPDLALLHVGVFHEAPNA